MGKASGKSHFEHQSFEDFDFHDQKQKDANSYLMIFCVNYIVTFDFQAPCHGLLGESASHQVILKKCSESAVKCPSMFEEALSGKSNF